MKKTIKLAVVAALALGATSAFATNGDVMIGQGAKSRAMGGVGIAKAFGAESALANPANISSVKDMEATLAVTVFMPSVSFNSNAAANAQNGSTNPVAVQSADSASNLSVIPEIYYAARLSDKLVLGLAIAGTAGMGVDYDGTAFGTQTDNGSFRMKTALSLLKVAVPVSYTIDGFTFGIEGVMQYGSLALSHMRQTPTGFSLLENGASTDIGYGLEAGLTYTTGGLTLGAVYKSKIGMTYDNTISASVNAFGGAAFTGIGSGDNLDQPEEKGVGISYAMGENTISADYKNIAWGDAAGYKDFGWENQDVYSVGYEYAAKSWAFRAGYNYAKSPIIEQDGNPMTAGNAAYGNSVKNFFNLAGFPGVVETHYTLGGGINLGDFTIDGAVIYVPEVIVSSNTTGMTAGFQANATQPANPANWDGSTSTADVTHSQVGVTIAGTYRF
ncbi:outer membrane protein transport protein [Sulfurimonas sp. SAG-AH-194-C21]|nr:outer membrane protein transport protein [Sulfurimonas sp. SAG-AH-194-C21]MDF1884448.1 outer membrane protein transport protein [Sulfurimonas sp. SAG-AH-194-C21]